MAKVFTSFAALRVELKRGHDKRKKAVQAAILETALYGADEVIARSEDLPVDLGITKSSIQGRPTATGAEIVVDSPQAAALEVGSRPHWAPLAPLMWWVDRHRASFDLARPKKPAKKASAARKARHTTEVDAYYAQVEAVARAIQRKIHARGTKPHWFMKNAQPKILAALDEFVKQHLGTSGS